MTIPRRSVWTLIAVLVASLLGPAGAGVALAADPPKCTNANEYMPPSTIRVGRLFGPAAGTVQVVDFWQYVGTVVRTEFSGGGFNAATLRAGAQAVKQYAWYYAIYWRGGTMNGACYDVVDSTADQLYHPEKRNPDGSWVIDHQPSPPVLEAMAATWHISLRKDFLNQKNKPNKMFLTGYRSGKAKPCGFEDGTFRLFQKSLKDCGVKGLTTEEMWRVYYGSNLYIVDVRDRDVLFEEGQWRGDAGLLSGGSQTTASFRAASSSGFDTPVAETLTLDLSKVLDQGVGDVTGVDVPADDPNTEADAYRMPRVSSNLADVVLLVKTRGARRKLWVVKSTGVAGDRFAAPIKIAVPKGVSRLLVDDFDGDMNADVGLVRSTPTAPGPGNPATLVVLRSLGNGSFSAPVDWWRGALDLTTTEVMSGDTNSDGKADLIFTDGSTHSVAPSTPSCLDLSVVGSCTQAPTVKLDVAVPWLTGTGWALANVHYAVGDKNRDGRDDLFAVVKDGAGVRVLVLRSNADGSFTNLGVQWQNGAVSFDSVKAVGFHANPDGFADLAMMQNTTSGTNAFWLQSSASGMSVVGTPVTDTDTAWPPATQAL